MTFHRSLTSIVSRILDFLLRRRSVAFILIRSGIYVLVATMGIAFAVRARVGEVDLQFSTENNAAAGWITIIGGVLGTALLLVGLCMAVWDWWLASRLASREKLIAVELRGLHNTPDTPLRAAAMCEARGPSEELLIDLRRPDTTTIDPHRALSQLAQLPSRLEGMRSGLDRNSVRIVTGGLAPVPCLFLAGMYLDDESGIQVVDWDRHARQWRALDAEDDGERFVISGLESVSSRASDVVVAVSVSYSASNGAIAATFGDYPLVELKLPTCLPGTQWSDQKGTALIQQFVEALARLTSKEVGTVHLVLACPASLATKLGMSYDRRNMPAAIVYQYERTGLPPFPWGIETPTHGMSVPRVVERRSAVSSDEVAA